MIVLNPFIKTTLFCGCSGFLTGEAAFKYGEFLRDKIRAVCNEAMKEIQQQGHTPCLAKDRDAGEDHGIQRWLDETDWSRSRGSLTECTLNRECCMTEETKFIVRETGFVFTMHMNHAVHITGPILKIAGTIVGIAAPLFSAWLFFPTTAVLKRKMFAYAAGGIGVCIGIGISILNNMTFSCGGDMD